MLDRAILKELGAWRTIRQPGNDDRERRHRAANLARRDVLVRKAIPDGVAPMARAASRGHKASRARKERTDHRANVASRARAANRARKASLVCKDRRVRAAKPDRPANCLRSNR